MVITEKDSVINGKDQRLIIAVSFMFIHFQLSDHSLIIFRVTVQHFLSDLFMKYVGRSCQFYIKCSALYPQVKRQVIDVLSSSVKGRFSLIVSFE